MALTDNLLHYRKLDETTWATSILNSVTATWEWTLANLTWWAGKINNWASFNGTSSWVDLWSPTDLAGFQYNTAFTFSAWIKTTTSTYGLIIAKDNWNVQYRLMIDATTHWLNRWVWKNETITNMGSAINDWKRHHIVWVCTGSALLAYVDWTYVGTGDYWTQTVATNTYLWRRTWWLYYTGSIDEFGVWNRALTAAEVTTLYNWWQWMTYDSTKAAFVPAPLTNNLISYWKFDEASGNAVDSVGSNTLTNNNSIAYSAWKINNGANFVSANTKYFSVADNGSLDITWDWSFSLWLYYTWIAIKNSALVTKWVSTTQNYGLIYRSYAPQSINIFNWTDNEIQFNSGLSTSTWYHIVVTRTWTTGRLYLNWVEQSASPKTLGGSFSANNSDFWVWWINWFSQYMDWSIDELWVWSRVLTPSEIASLYNAWNWLAYPLTSGVVKTLVVAWWASGWDRFGAWWGAGWLVYDAAHTVTSQAYTVTVGDWGTAVTWVWTTRHQWNNWNNSVFDTITALGWWWWWAYSVASWVWKNWGSGWWWAYQNWAAGTATQGNSWWGLWYGFAWWANANNLWWWWGWWAWAVGSPSTTASWQPSVWWVWWVGRVNPITWSTAGQNVTWTYYLAWGWGGSSTAETTVWVAGWYWWWWAGARGNDTPWGSWTANTGWGWGWVNDTEDVAGKSSWAWGSWVVVISYPTDWSAWIYPTSTWGTITTSWGNTIHTFTSTWTLTVVTSPSLNTGNFFLFF